jgi:hypothetical protein
VEHLNASSGLNAHDRAVLPSSLYFDLEIERFEKTWESFMFELLWDMTILFEVAMF